MVNAARGRKKFLEILHSLHPSFRKGKGRDFKEGRGRKVDPTFLLLRPEEKKKKRRKKKEKKEEPSATILFPGSKGRGGGEKKSLCRKNSRAPSSPHSFLFFRFRREKEGKKDGRGGGEGGGSPGPAALSFRGPQRNGKGGKGVMLKSGHLSPSSVWKGGRKKRPRKGEVRVIHSRRRKGRGGKGGLRRPHQLGEVKPGRRRQHSASFSRPRSVFEGGGREKKKREKVEEKGGRERKNSEHPGSSFFLLVEKGRVFLFLGRKRERIKWKPARSSSLGPNLGAVLQRGERKKRRARGKRGGTTRSLRFRFPSPRSRKEKERKGEGEEREAQTTRYPL